MSERTDDEITVGADLTSDETHQSQVAQRHYEPDGQGELTTAIIYAIAEAEGVPPSAVTLPPLYESVDVPAIEGTFFGPDISDESRQCAGAVEFRYADYLVTVRSDGRVRVFEPTEPDLS